MPKKKIPEGEKVKIGARLRELRELKGVSQSEVAKEINISKKSISCYENNITTPPIIILEKLADYYNKSIDYIVKGREIEYKEIKVSDEKLLNCFEKIDNLDVELKKPLEIVLNGFILGYSKNNN